MHRSIILFGLLFSLNACDQAPEQSEKEYTTSNQAPLNNQASLKKSSTTPHAAKPDINENNSAENVGDRSSYPSFFIEVAKNLNIPTEEFAQAMKRAGDNDASMESVAKELGVSIEDLRAALPKLPPKKIRIEPSSDVEIIESTSDKQISE